MRSPSFVAFPWIAATVLRKEHFWSVIQTVHRWFDPRRQLIYCPVHRLTEILRYFPFRSSLKGLTDLRAMQPESGIFLLIDRGFLVKGEPEVRCHVG